MLLSTDTRIIGFPLFKVLATPISVFERYFNTVIEDRVEILKSMHTTSIELMLQY